ncbi:MAG: cation diffusion facilitator family transporter [Halioglobus sp.]
MTERSTTRLPPAEAARLMQLATYASTTVAVILIFAKLIAWGASGSVSLLATLIDSTLDALASIINLFAVRHAITPADSNHRFGHGKAEALAGLGQAAFITGSACFLLLESARRIIEPVPIQAQGIGITVMVFSIIATLMLLQFQKHVISKTGSTAIQADALHYKTDLMVNGTVIVALLLASTGWARIDALFAIAIALYILWSAWEIVMQALDHLMDKELPDSDRTHIMEVASHHDQVHGLHDLRTRRSGTATFMQLHLELDDDLTLLQAHKISDEVEYALQQAFPEAEVIIHIDPVSVVAGEPTPEFPEHS